MNTRRIVKWGVIIIPFVLLVYNAYLKLSANPGAIALFTGLALEPYGRLSLGAAELCTGLLLLYPATMKYGAVLGTVLMAGVILMHLIKLGIALNGDYSFFIMGAIAFLCCISLCGISVKKAS